MFFYWTRKQGEFAVGKGGITCDIIFHVEVKDGEVVITRKERALGKTVKEESRTVPLTDFVDTIHKLWWATK